MMMNVDRRELEKRGVGRKLRVWENKKGEELWSGLNGATRREYGV